MSQSTYSAWQATNSRFGELAYRSGGNPLIGVQQRARVSRQAPESASARGSLATQAPPSGLEISTPSNGARLAPALAPVRAVLKLQKYWGLTDLEMVQLCGLSLDDADNVGPALSRHFMLPAVQDRLQSAMSIRARLSALFNGDRESELKWLMSPWSVLNDRRPLDLLTSRDIFILEAVVREFAGG